MRTDIESDARRRPFRIPWLLGFCLFAAIAVFFLWQEHEAHILGALPYVLLLLCPIIHLFMHRGHGAHGRAGRDDGAHAQHRHDGGLS